MSTPMEMKIKEAFRSPTKSSNHRYVRRSNLIEITPSNFCMFCLYWCVTLINNSGRGEISVIMFIIRCWTMHYSSQLNLWMCDLLFTDEKTELRDDKTWKRHLAERRQLELECRYLYVLSSTIGTFSYFEAQRYGNFVLVSKTWFRRFFLRTVELLDLLRTVDLWCFFQ